MLLVVKVNIKGSFNLSFMICKNPSVNFCRSLHKLKCPFHHFTENNNFFPTAIVPYYPHKHTSGTYTNVYGKFWNPF